jgi:hypothetical protein
MVPFAEVGKGLISCLLDSIALVVQEKASIDFTLTLGHLPRPLFGWPDSSEWSQVAMCRIESSLF